MEWPWDALGALWCPWIPHGMCGRWVSRSGMVVWCGVVLGTVVHVTVSGIWCYEMSFMPCNAVFVCVVHA